MIRMTLWSYTTLTDSAVPCELGSDAGGSAGDERPRTVARVADAVTGSKRGSNRNETGAM